MIWSTSQVTIVHLVAPLTDEETKLKHTTDRVAELTDKYKACHSSALCTMDLQYYAAGIGVYTMQY
jgi:hypothetical protein